MAFAKTLKFAALGVVVVAGGLGVWAYSTGTPSIPNAEAADMMVYKSPTCGCCTAWIEHIEDSGITVEVRDTYDLEPIKARMGVPGRMESCHTAMIDGYVIEGHVPATDIKRLLKEKPAARGLAVPGMPIGSPGMEQGDIKDPYAVVLFGEKGYQIYSRHN